MPESVVGHDEFTNVRFEPMLMVVPYKFSDLDASFKLKITIPAGTFVMWVAHLVKTPFSGGSPQIDIGDGSDVDAWIGNASITDGSANDYVSSANLATSLAAKGGFYFATPGLIEVDQVTGLTAGAGEVHICYYTVDHSWREAMPPAWSLPHPANWGM